MKTALITGVNGQDGAHLSELLLSKDYIVYGLKRRSSSNNLWRLKNVINNRNFKLIEGDVADTHSMQHHISKIVENASEIVEIYNLAAQSHVHTSFDQPGYTFDVNFKGVLNILETLRLYKDFVRFYQASTSEMFGDNASLSWTELGQRTYPSTKYAKFDDLQKSCLFQNEKTTFSPMSPYAVAKTAAHHLVNNYRKAYGLHASCGILFNHEGEYRGEEFLTQKVCRYVAHLQPSVFSNTQQIPKLKLGNLDSYRDFGYASDYVKAMWLMLQQDSPDDYVIATGKTTQIREFVKKAFDHIGLNWQDWVECDESLKRPSEVDYLLGKADKAKEKLGWTHTVEVDELVKIMVDSNYERATV